MKKYLVNTTVIISLFFLTVGLGKVFHAYFNHGYSYIVRAEDDEEEDEHEEEDEEDEEDDEDEHEEEDEYYEEEYEIIYEEVPVEYYPVPQVTYVWVTDEGYDVDSDGDILVDAIDPNPFIHQSELFTDSDGDSVPDAYDIYPGEDDYYYIEDFDDNNNGILDSYE
jgi:hypothetical protein